MDKLTAIDRILGDDRLGRLEMLVLLQMVRLSGINNVCSVSKVGLAEACHTDRRSVYMTIDRLAAQGYVHILNRAGGQQSGRYVPYPYTEEMIHVQGGKQLGSSRLTITAEQAATNLSVLIEKESSLTLLARDAQSRRDLAAHKKLCLQIDEINDLKDILEKFIVRKMAK